MPQRESSTDRATAAGAVNFGPEWRPTRVAVAPGRLELLGNHVDYNGGKVLAGAIDRGVAVVSASAPDLDGRIEATFADFADGGVSSIPAADLHDWRHANSPPQPADYVRGVVAALQARPMIGLATGFRLAIAGDVPIGFGLSSSAALCVSLTLSLAAVEPDPTTLVLLAQEAEHRAGTPCGTMDQSASVAGGVILYDAARMDVTPLQPDLGPYVFAVADSGVKRSLGASSYPVRVREAAEMLAIARRILGRDLPYLSAVTRADLDELRSKNHQIPSHLLRRATHVVTETERVHQGIEAVDAGDWRRFGRLMSASGRSSAVNYEISHPWVEELVASALTVKGVLGARMMGGGEGGAALVLVARKAARSLQEQLIQGYYARQGRGADGDLIHVFSFATGASIHTIAPR